MPLNQSVHIAHHIIFIRVACAMGVSITQSEAGISNNTI